MTTYLAICENTYGIAKDTKFFYVFLTMQKMNIAS